MTFNEVRNSGFWVLHGSSAVRKLISQCVLCCLMLSYGEIMMCKL